MFLGILVFHVVDIKTAGRRWEEQELVGSKDSIPCADTGKHVTWEESQGFFIGQKFQTRSKKEK